MPKVELVALESIAYAGKRHAVGAKFLASAKDAKLLAAIGKATAAPVVVEPPKAKDVAAETPKRPYRRRDMTAGQSAGYQRSDLTAKD